MTVASRIQLLAVSLVLLLASGASAQSTGFGGQGFTGSYGPGMENLNRGASTEYLPSGGGFLPYTPGPGGGLGVQSRMSTGSSATSVWMSTMPRAPAPGEVRGGLSPMAPISGMSASSGRMGSGRLLNSLPAGRGMGGRMARPPVGSYPFRIPPSLLGPATQSAAMSM